MYLDYFSLKENPFNVTSDPGFLYLSGPHKEALDHLHYGIKYRRGFIVITGEVGAGKTTLCRALLNTLDHETVKSSIILNSSLPEKQLLESILHDLGLTPKGRSKGALIRQLNEFLICELSRNNNVVLIIDESQNLSHRVFETIRMLSNLETEKEKLIQIVLAGQPELNDKLDSPKFLQLKQRVSVRFHLGALSKDEISAYIYHRLKVAGSAGNIEFDDSAIELIKDFSKGIPRLINVVCDKSLLLGFVRESFNISHDMVKKSIDELEFRPVSIPHRV